MRAKLVRRILLLRKMSSSFLAAQGYAMPPRSATFSETVNFPLISLGTVRVLPFKLIDDLLRASGKGSFVILLASASLSSYRARPKGSAEVVSKACEISWAMTANSTVISWGRLEVKRSLERCPAKSQRERRLIFVADHSRHRPQRHNASLINWLVPLTPAMSNWNFIKGLGVFHQGRSSSRWSSCIRFWPGAGWPVWGVALSRLDGFLQPQEQASLLSDPCRPQSPVLLCCSVCFCFWWRITACTSSQALSLCYFCIDKAAFLLDSEVLEYLQSWNHIHRQDTVSSVKNRVQEREGCAKFSMQHGRVSDLDAEAEMLVWIPFK